MDDVQKLRALLDAIGAADDCQDEPLCYSVITVAALSGGKMYLECRSVEGANRMTLGATAHPVADRIAALIAGAVNALPEMLDEVERLQAFVSAAERRAEEAEAQAINAEVERDARGTILDKLRDLAGAHDHDDPGWWIGAVDACVKAFRERDEIQSALAEALDVVTDVIFDLREIAGAGWSREGCIARAKEALPKLKALETTATGKAARSRVHAAEASAGNMAREAAVARARIAELGARKAEMRECVKCGGSGGVITEGEK